MRNETNNERDDEIQRALREDREILAAWVMKQNWSCSKWLAGVIVDGKYRDAS